MSLSYMCCPCSVTNLPRWWDSALPITSSKWTKKAHTQMPIVCVWQALPNVAGGTGQVIHALIKMTICATCSVTSLFIFLGFTCSFHSRTQHKDFFFFFFFPVGLVKPLPADCLHIPGSSSTSGQAYILYLFIFVTQRASLNNPPACIYFLSYI